MLSWWNEHSFECCLQIYKDHMTKEAKDKNIAALAKAAKAGDNASLQSLKNAGYVLITSNQPKDAPPKDAPPVPELYGWQDGRPRRDI